MRPNDFILRLGCRTAILLTALICTTELHALPPANDTCAGALVIPANGPFPYLTPLVNISEATTNGDPVLPGIGDCRSGAVSRSVWFVFTPAMSAAYTISTCGDTETTLPDPTMAIYAASGPCAGFTLFDCADDICGIRPAIEANLVAGASYYIVVWNSGNLLPSANQASVQLRISPPLTAPNDLCAGAQVIPGAGPFPHFTVPADTRLAGTAGDPPNPACMSLRPERSLWYEFTPTESGLYNFSLCGDTATTVYDTLLAIYSAASCSGPFTRIACDDDGCGEAQSVIATNLVAGTRYYIVAWDPDHTVGESLIQLRVATPAPGLISGRRLENGSFRLEFMPNFRQRYTVEASTNLTMGWAAIGSITNGNPVFTDTNAAAWPRRFYRVRTP